MLSVPLYRKNNFNQPFTQREISIQTLKKLIKLPSNHRQNVD